MELTVDGRTAYAYTGGTAFDPALPCIVMLHGALHDHSVWTLLARWFAHHGYSVLAPDLPAHGRSEGPPLESVEAMAAWALKLVDASAGSARCSFIGHSMGSLVALEAAAIAGPRATSLALIATAGPMQVSAALLDAARDRQEEGLAMVNALSFSTLAGKPAYPGPGSWLHGGNLQLMRRMLKGSPGHNLFVNDFAACNAYAGAIAAASGVTCPAWVISGEQDRMTPPRASNALAAALKARRINLPGGHALMQEQPEALLGAVRTAIQGIPDQATSRS